MTGRNTRNTALKLIAIIALALPAWAKAQVWKPLDDGLPAVPVAVCGFGNNVYAAWIDSLDHDHRRINVSQWDGRIWEQLPSILCNNVVNINAMVIYKNSLYLGGYFDTVYKIAGKSGIIMFDGDKWRDVAKRNSKDTFKAKINALEVYNGKMYAGGSFVRIDTVFGANLSVYDGVTFRALVKATPELVNGEVKALRVYNNRLHLGGSFLKFQSSKAYSIGVWNDTTYQTDTLAPLKQVQLLEPAGARLVAFGLDQSAKKSFMFFESNKWETRIKGVPLTAITWAVNDLAFYKNEIWACGTFYDTGGHFYNFIKWKDSLWAGTDEISNIAAPRFLISPPLSPQRLYVFGSFTGYRQVRMNHAAEFMENTAIVGGKVFFDKNQNGIPDTGEIPLPLQLVKLTQAGNTAYMLSTLDGTYRFFVGTKDACLINIVPRKYWGISAGGTNSFGETPAPGKVSDSLNFALFIDDNIEDVRVKILGNAGLKARSGRTEMYNLSFENTGGSIVPIGKIKLRVDDSLKNFISDPLPTITNGNEYQWVFNNLLPGQTKLIRFEGQAPQSTGKPLNFFVESASMSDNDMSDNYDTLSQTVDDDSTLQGKYIFPQPTLNDTITVFQKGQTDVEYLIRFENRGSDTVRSVTVIDTIDLNLAIEYIQELGASHNYYTQVVNCAPNLGKGVLIWTFPNINLPPAPSGSNDFTANRGHIGFKIKLSSGLADGTIVKNKAEVFFDYKPPYSTNYVFGMVDYNLSVKQQFAFEGVSAYPNPAGNTLFIKTAGNTLNATLTDMLGRQCYSLQAVANSQTQVNISALPPGIYYLNLSDGVHSSTLKIVKE